MTRLSEVTSIIRNFFLIIFPLFVFFSCTEKESDLGMDLQDPSTIYNGVRDTAYGVAYTVFDDSLLTSGQTSALLGCYIDPLYGMSEAIIYTQMTSPNGEGVEFDQYCHIDSVVLSLSVSELFTSGFSEKSYHDLHFEVYQLAETLTSDSAKYYADNSTPVNGNCLFNDVVRFADADTMVVNIKLNDNIINLLSNHSYTTAADFNNAIKGLRIRLVNDGDPTMATINMAASATRVTAYFTYDNGTESTYRYYEFTIGHGVTHYNQYINNYTGVLSAFNTNRHDSLDGSQYLYLVPMGGTNIKFNIDNFVQQFKQAHPYAIIHYAELLLPVADASQSNKPDQIVALKYASDGLLTNVPDMYDAFTYKGFDGTYDNKNGYYRMRITQHLQKIMREGCDYGTLLVINGRRSSPAHIKLNGTSLSATSGNPIRIEFIYSE